MEEMAWKLTTYFRKHFQPDEVERKWLTLVRSEAASQRSEAASQRLFEEWLTMMRDSRREFLQVFTRMVDTINSYLLVK
ncbi:unnamed protein product [Gadus morhua 'NCC']